MKKIVNLLLYCLLGIVVSAGALGMRHFMVQDKERIEQEAEVHRQEVLAREQAEQEARQQEEERKRKESRRVVLVQSLPLYPEKKIQKVKSGRNPVCTYGETVTLLEEDGLYAKVQTSTGETGYVWGDCITPMPEGNVTTDKQPKVVVLDVEQSGKKEDQICFSVAQNVEKRLEALGYQAVLACRDTQEAPSDAKRAELASQLGADVVVRIYTDSEDTQKEAGITGSDHETDTDPATDDPTRADDQEADPTQTDDTDTEANPTQTDDADQEADPTKTDDTDQDTGAPQTNDTDQDTDPAQTDDTENPLKTKDIAIFCSSQDNPHPAAKYYTHSRKLAKYILKYYQAITGFNSGEMVETSDLQAVNLSKRPMVMLCLGSLQNEQQAEQITKPKFQAKMAKGITDGVDAYFRKKS